MARIFYNLAGEGRGHAARVRALVERFKHRHEIAIFTSDDAFDFLDAYELSSLPFDLRCYANMMAIAVNAYGIEPDRTVVSAFHRPSLRPGYRDVIQIGPLLRPEVALATPRDGDFLLSYLRPATPPHALQAIRAAGIETRIYGLGPRPDEGCL
ncbi:MAG: hypothetical protein KJZ87_03965 [Thermoguttaceae bacterium]|nr:hypothetical protein [Thermoguttaceae bacterium]